MQWSKRKRCRHSGWMARLSHGSVEGMTSDPRYPIGKFSSSAILSPQERAAAVDAIAKLPQEMREVVRGLSEARVDTPYREDGWTMRQTVHHVADSHMQSSGRVRLALTEDWPVITPYKENLWAELADARTMPVDVSLKLLDAVHARWAVLLRSLTENDWTTRGHVHPQMGKQTLQQIAALYAWHGRHHTAQIRALRER